jgi:hypothetical protein
MARFKPGKWGNTTAANKRKIPVLIKNRERSPESQSSPSPNPNPPTNPRKKERSKIGPKKKQPIVTLKEEQGTKRSNVVPVNRTNERKNTHTHTRSSGTWEIPRLALADVDLGDDLGLGVDLAGDLALEVVPHQLLVRGVEPEAERQRLELHHHLRSLKSQRQRPVCGGFVAERGYTLETKRRGRRGWSGVGGNGLGFGPDGIGEVLGGGRGDATRRGAVGKRASGPRFTASPSRKFPCIYHTTASGCSPPRTAAATDAGVQIFLSHFGVLLYFLTRNFSRTNLAAFDLVWFSVIHPDQMKWIQDLGTTTCMCMMLLNRWVL